MDLPDPRRPEAPRAAVGSPAVVCRDLTVRYGPVVALDGLDLELHLGRVTALVGPNGAGKTTLLRALAGLVRPDRGGTEVLGLDPAREPVEVRRRIGLLPDRPTLPAHLTVSELLELRGRLYGLGRETIADRRKRLTAELGLDGLLHRPGSALSHGQAQRAALAAVLVSRPTVLLADEPMTALDLEAQIAVRGALRRRVDEGAAAVITTHVIAHVAALADDVVAIRSGKNVARRRGTRDVEELEQWLLAAPGA